MRVFVYSCLIIHAYQKTGAKSFFISKSIREITSGALFKGLSQASQEKNRTHPAFCKDIFFDKIKNGISNRRAKSTFII